MDSQGGFEQDIFLNNKEFDNQMGQLDYTSKSLKLDEANMFARESDANGTDAIEYLIDKIHFLRDVSNSYKDFVSEDVETLLDDSKENINDTSIVSGDNIDSGQQGE